MKQLKPFLLGAMLLIAFAVTQPGKLRAAAPTAEPVTEAVECEFAQCKAIAKSTKKRCKRCVSSRGDTYCYQHK
jgi:hypothetical protein